MEGTNGKLNGINELTKRHNKITQKMLDAVQKSKIKFLRIIKTIMFICVILGILKIVYLAIHWIVKVDIVPLIGCWLSQNIDLICQVGIWMTITIICLIVFFVLHYFIKKSEKQNKKIVTFSMKDFLYLNMNFLETFTAQKDEGFISDIKYETEKVNSIKKDVFLGSRDLGATYSNEDTNIKREVRSMRQREDMLDAFLNSKLENGEPLVKVIDARLINEKIIDEELISGKLENVIGKYICFKTYFDFISLKRLEALTASKKQKFYSDRKKLYSTADEFQRIQDIQENIEYLKILLPFDSFLTAKNAVVLMENEPLREANNQTGFKFNSNNIVVVGKIYRKIGIRKNSAPINQMLDKIQLFTASLLRKIGVLSEDDSEPIYLITPIAIYSEEDVRKENK